MQIIPKIIFLCKIQLQNLMENFIFFNPTKLHFGKDVHLKLGKTIKKYGQNVLLVCGQNSIKKNGIYESCIHNLKQQELNILEFSGIKPNPRIEEVYEAIKLGKKHNINIVLAIGGGSVIDSAKIIAAGIPSEEDVWDYFTTSLTPKKCLPLITVLTIAATGSEMNSYSVLQKTETLQKIGIGHPLLFPKESFLNPEFTYSVSPYQTACGMADIIAHSLEHWFGYGNSPLTDKIIKSTIHEIFEIAEPLLHNLNDYELRSRMLHASTMALNGITAMGKTSADWGVHDIGHTLSVLFDIPHGESLAMVYPAWLRVVPKNNDEKLIRFATEIMMSENINKAITKLETFFNTIGLTSKLNTNMQNELNKNAAKSTINKLNINGLNYKMNNKSREDIIKILFS